MSSNENTETNNSELTRLDNFVNAAPGNEYTIDQKEQTLCRQAANGQRDCVKLNLECKYHGIWVNREWH